MPINRILAADIKSKADSPPFDMSSMDGYAVKINKNLIKLNLKLFMKFLLVIIKTLKF